MKGKRMFVAVVGGRQCSQEEAKLAEAVGVELAKRGVTLVCGGLGGVMEAACRGARSAKGVTVGILPGSMRDEANPHVDIPVVTGMGEARNVIVVNTAQAVIAIGGKYGTLSEIAYALRNNVPVIGLNTWMLAKKGRSVRSIIAAQSPKEAVEKALAAIGGETK